MVKRSKNYRNATQKIVNGVLHSPLEAMCLARETSTTEFDAIVEVMFRLGVDPRKADQMVRGIANLPHGTDKAVRVLVFAVGPCAQKTIDAEADEVDGDELIKEAAGGYTNFDVTMVTPDLMGKVGRLGRVFSPRGLMSSPKTGTVIMNITKAVSDIKGGRIEFRVDKNGNSSSVVGRVSFTPEQFVESYATAQEGVLRLKSSTSKGRYLLKGTITTTMGPDIPLDTSKTRNLTSEDPS